MAYKFVEKRKTTQEEMAYIVYMMVSSYFHQAKCRNQRTADMLYLYYAEMNGTTQAAKEQKIIAQAETVLEAYENVLSVMNCEVLINFKEGSYVLDFITGFERIHAEVNRQGGCEIQIFQKGKSKH